MKIKWLKLKSRAWDILDVGTIFKFKEGDKVTVIDMTLDSWVKQLKSITNQKIHLADSRDSIANRHAVHRRCKTSVTIKENSLYCNKCKLKLPSKDIRRWSRFTNHFLKVKNVFIGISLIENGNIPTIAIDLEYTRRYRLEEEIEE